MKYKCPICEVKMTKADMQGELFHCPNIKCGIDSKRGLCKVRKQPCTLEAAVKKIERIIESQYHGNSNHPLVVIRKAISNLADGTRSVQMEKYCLEIEKALSKIKD